MRPALLLFFLLLPCMAAAQQLTGIVLDGQTNLPVKDAMVSQGISAVRTDAHGIFHLVLSVVADSITIYAIGYQHRRLRVRAVNALDTTTVYLSPLQSSLQEVIVKGRNYRKDSLFLRQQFAKQFNFRGPTVTDVFTQYKSPYEAPSVSIGVSTLVAALTKKMSKDYKLQQKMLRYEKERFIDDRFNEDLVRRVTALQADSLAHFMRDYRPTQAFLQTCTEYELLLYIKNNCEKYRHTAAAPLPAKTDTAATS